MSNYIKLLNYKEYLTILKGLTEFKKERDLTSDIQLDGLLGNLLEELCELERAQTDLESIDALCDIIVFLLNATEYTDIDNINQDELINNFIGTYPNANIEKFEYSTEELIELITKCPKNLKDGREIISTINIAIFILTMMISKLGYNPYKCMMETIKEISSRKGYWDNNIKKFIKFPGVYSAEEIKNHLNAISINILEEDYEFYRVQYMTKNKNIEVTVVYKWYKANYINCKLDMYT